MSSELEAVYIALAEREAEVREAALIGQSLLSENSALRDEAEKHAAEREEAISRADDFRRRLDKSEYDLHAKAMQIDMYAAETPAPPTRNQSRSAPWALKRFPAALQVRARA